VLLSLYVPVALNCCVPPREIEGAPGVTEIEVSTGAVTVKVADPLIGPKVAAIVAVPWAALVARPPLPIVAMFVADEDHVTVPVSVCLVPSL